MTPPRTSHPWAIVEGGRVRFHRPGSWPPEYAVNDELEALWRKGQTMGVPRDREMGDGERELGARTPGVPKQMPAIGSRPKGKGGGAETARGIQAYRNESDTKRPGVPKQMPAIAASQQRGAPERGVQALRDKESYTMTDTIKAPFPWPGGKSDMAPAVWSRFGQPDNFVEPFCGSAAMLLGRPGGAHGTETVNDVDGLLINAYRCIQFAPDETAEWCDWPVSEADLTSRHLYLKANRDDLTARLFADPAWCDPMLGGWWLWGIASWIGDGWCVADGPWINVDGRLVDRRLVGSDADGVTKQMPQVTRGPFGTDGTLGIQRYRASVPRQMPMVAQSGYGQADKGVQAYRHHARVPRQMPMVGAGDHSNGTKRGYTKDSGVQFARRESDSALAAYFARLSDRLRRVRFLCGDWRRACKDSVTVNHGLTAVFLDPPYPAAEHDMAYHEAETGDVWYQAAAWAVEKGDDPRLRICIAGYFSDATDALFPPTWERVRWEARGGYANQKADGRGRANAKRECLFFSPHCIDAKTDYGPLFAGLGDE